MAYTLSNMLPLGTKAPDFTLDDVVDGKENSLDELKSDVATVIMFICNHCPYVIHLIRDIVDTANEYSAKGLKFIAVSLNVLEYAPHATAHKNSHRSKVRQ